MLIKPDGKLILPLNTNLPRSNKSTKKHLDEIMAYNWQWLSNKRFSQELNLSSITLYMFKYISNTVLSKWKSRWNSAAIDLRGPPIAYNMQSQKKKKKKTKTKTKTNKKKKKKRTKKKTKKNKKKKKKKKEKKKKNKKKKKQK